MTEMGQLQVKRQQEQLMPSLVIKLDGNEGRDPSRSIVGLDEGRAVETERRVDGRVKKQSQFSLWVRWLATYPNEVSASCDLHFQQSKRLSILLLT